jgi:undecaprenyl-diphosphatase
MRHSGVLAIIVCLGVPWLGVCSAQDSAPGGPQARPPQRIGVLEAAILGVIEGLTEYLPVSSTGHLILAGQAMGLTRFSDRQGPLGPLIEPAPAINAFEIVIQLGAILAVLGLYRRRVGQMLAGLIGRSRAGAKLAGLLLVAFLPAAAVGLALRDVIETYLFSSLAVSLALAGGGAAMIAAEYFFWIRKGKQRPVRRLDDVTFRQALLIGLAQCLSLWPGMSRSMVTIVAALVVGLDMVAAAEFSFLLALPTLGAATLYEAASNWSALQASAGPEGLVVGLAISALVAAVTVRALVRWLTTHGLIPFGIYRLLLAGAVYLYFLQAT